MGVLAVVLVLLVVAAVVLTVRARRQPPAPLPLVTPGEARNTQEKLDAARRASAEHRALLAARAAGDPVEEALRVETSAAWRTLSRVDRDGLPQR